jgi:hypothetical protein
MGRKHRVNNWRGQYKPIFSGEEPKSTGNQSKNQQIGFHQIKDSSPQMKQPTEWRDNLQNGKDIYPTERYYLEYIRNSKM